MSAQLDYTFDTTKVKIEEMSDTTMADVLIKDVAKSLVNETGTVHILVHAYELAHQGRPIKAMRSLMKAVRARSRKGLETNLMFVVRSIRGWFSDIGLRAIQRAQVDDRNLQIIEAKKLLADNEISEVLLFALRDRFASGKLKGVIEFRAHPGVTGDNYMMIGVGTINRSERKLRITCKHTSEVPTFANIAKVVRDETALADQEDRDFNRYFFQADPDPQPIHRPDLAEIIVDDARAMLKYLQANDRVKYYSSEDMTVHPNILNQINSIY